jgi:hypothetical protein
LFCVVSVVGKGSEQQRAADRKFVTQNILSREISELFPISKKVLNENPKVLSISAIRQKSGAFIDFQENVEGNLSLQERDLKDLVLDHYFLVLKGTVDEVFSAKNQISTIFGTQTRDEVLLTFALC